MPVVAGGGHQQSFLRTEAYILFSVLTQSKIDHGRQRKKKVKDSKIERSGEMMMHKNLQGEMKRLEM